jgi:hypothetical protein
VRIAEREFDWQPEAGAYVAGPRGTDARLDEPTGRKTATQRLAARKARRRRPDDELLHMAPDGTITTMANATRPVPSRTTPNSGPTAKNLRDLGVVVGAKHDTVLIRATTTPRSRGVGGPDSGIMVGMPSLTRAEAAARAQIIEVDAYDVDLDLTGTGGTFRSRTVLTFRAPKAAARSWSSSRPADLGNAERAGRSIRGMLADVRVPSRHGRAATSSFVEAERRTRTPARACTRFVRSRPDGPGCTCTRTCSLDGGRGGIHAVASNQPRPKGAVHRVVTGAEGAGLVASELPPRPAPASRRPVAFEPTTPLSHVRRRR